MAKISEKIEQIYETGLDTKSRTLLLQGEVDDEMLHNVECSLTILENISKEPINIRLSTGGGNVYAGCAIIDRIENSPCEIHIHAAGEIMSMGILLLAAGDVRTSGELTVFMWHEESDTVEGRLSQSKSYLKFSDKLDDRLCRWMGTRTKKPYKFWKDLGKGQDYYFFKEEAIEIGLINETN